MSKNQKSRDVPVQKGPINMDEQYTYKFCPASERVMRDIQMNIDRVSGQTLTYHEPKR